MVLHVLEAARAARRLDRVVVATDDERIAAAVRRAGGGEAILTSPEAASGTDRLAEAARSLPADVYVNIQGDEPHDVRPRTSTARRDAARRPGPRASRRSRSPLPAAEAADPNVVKVAVARDGRALYFSRSPIPFYRQGEPAYRKHLGLYAYRAATLRASSRRCRPRRSSGPSRSSSCAGSRPAMRSGSARPPRTRSASTRPQISRGSKNCGKQGGRS